MTGKLGRLGVPVWGEPVSSDQLVQIWNAFLNPLNNMISSKMFVGDHPLLTTGGNNLRAFLQRAMALYDEQERLTVLPLGNAMKLARVRAAYAHAEIIAARNASDAGGLPGSARASDLRPHARHGELCTLVPVALKLNAENSTCAPFGFRKIGFITDTPTCFSGLFGTTFLQRYLSLIGSCC